MMSVGIRELRQRASELLRQVERGESIEITDRGRPVAVISPLPPGSPYRRMLVEGEIARASRQTGGLPEPVALSPGQESASAVLARLRSDER
jgi:prevent-host-death family protein